MSMLSDWMHPDRGYRGAEDQMSQYYNQAQGYMAPYNQYGIDAGNRLQGGMDWLLNPQKLQDEWAKNYKLSDQAKLAQDMAQQHGLDAASSMGLLGSSPALSAIQAGTSQIGLQDRQSYMDDLMNKYMQGIGVAGNMYGTGSQMAGNMGQNSMNMGRDMGQMEYNRRNAKGNLFGNVLGTGAGLLGSYLGG